MKKMFSILLALALIMGLMAGTAVAAAPPNWDISGTWDVVFSKSPTVDRGFVDLVQDEFGNVEGSYYWSNNLGEWEYGGTVEGFVSGDDLYLDYDRDPINYTGVFEGTITKNEMTGTCNFSSGFHDSWVATGNARLLYEARVTGGGQLRTESGYTNKSGKDINYKISFGLGAFIVNGAYWLDGTTVTYHNVSNPDVVGGKFEAVSLTSMNFFGDGSVANYTVLGTFNDEPGYKMIVRAQDSGEPGVADNLRLTLYHGTAIVYDSLTDFPGESSDFGGLRNTIEKGNLQVEELK